jgi:hypothetical protein
MTLFSPSQGGLRCTHCQTVYAPPAASTPIVEHDLLAQFASQPRGLDLPHGSDAEVTKTTVCKECGAAVLFAGRIVATVCTFCRSPTVLAQTENRQPLRPESLVRFHLDFRQAQDCVARWVHGLWFRPSDLARSGRTERFLGIYIPFFTFDAHAESSWTAKAGFDYSESESYSEVENGETVHKTRQVTKTRWESARGARSDDYDDVLVCASGGLAVPLSGAVAKFDTTALTPYSPDYLAGFLAEESAIPIDQAWVRAEQTIRSEQERRCDRDVPGDRHEDLRVDTQLSAPTFKHVLLPLWVGAYRYRGRTYRILVNGQSGQITGDAPYSVFKIAGALLLLFALLLAGFLWHQYQSDNSPPPSDSQSSLLPKPALHRCVLDQSPACGLPLPDDQRMTCCGRLAAGIPIPG